jgi:hypothetical protein
MKSDTPPKHRRGKFDWPEEFARAPLGRIIRQSRSPRQVDWRMCREKLASIQFKPLGPQTKHPGQLCRGVINVFARSDLRSGAVSQFVS